MAKLTESQNGSLERSAQNYTQGTNQNSHAHRTSAQRKSAIGGQQFHGMGSSRRDKSNDGYSEINGNISLGRVTLDKEKFCAEQVEALGIGKLL